MAVKEGTDNTHGQEDTGSQQYEKLGSQRHLCSSYLLVHLVLYWIARFFSNRVDKALSPVRVFDCKIENALVIDLQELREIFRDEEVFASLNLSRCQLYRHFSTNPYGWIELSTGNTIITA